MNKYQGESFCDSTRTFFYKSFNIGCDYGDHDAKQCSNI